MAALSQIVNIAKASQCHWLAFALLTSCPWRAWLSSVIGQLCLVAIFQCLALYTVYTVTWSHLAVVCDWSALSGGNIPMFGTVHSVYCDLVSPGCRLWLDSSVWWQYSNAWHCTHCILWPGLTWLSSVIGQLCLVAIFQYLALIFSKNLAFCSPSTT